MPTECPKQSVTALLARNRANASQVNSGGPSTTAAAVMVPIHSDFAGAQRTVPSTGSVRASATIRSEPGTRAKASPCATAPHACDNVRDSQIHSVVR